MTDKFYNDLKEFVEFESDTATVYPWAIEPAAIMYHANSIFDYCYGNSDIECIYNAIDFICGVNPNLTMKE